MTATRCSACAAIALACLADPLAQAPPPPASADAFAFVRALDEAGARRVWTGFNPSDLPIALFDGEKTLLLRHPSPPPEFKPMPDRPGVFVSLGRHAGVVANSTREIGGIRTATVLAVPGQNVHSTLLACVEEVFHVFWLARHTSFRPNEMARYAYPVKDPANLERLLAEDEALARAIEADGDADAARWAATALGIRRERTPTLTEEARRFETALEMMEGTANYVARIALGERPAQTSARLRKGRPAEGIRWRYYDTGAALCFLLDRFEPGWKTRIDSEPELTIGELIGASLARRNVEPHAFSEREVAGFTARATGDVTELSGRQQRLRGELLERSGVRVIVQVAEGGEPFRVPRFDPVNLLVLDAGEVVHPNFITLSSSSGTVEMTNAGFARGSFAGTVGISGSAGAHPLADGVRQLTIVGVKGTPSVVRNAGAVTLEAPGVRVTLRGAEAREDGELIRITVNKPQP